MRDDLVFHYKLARPVTFTRNHTSLVRFRQVRSAVAAPFGSVHTPSSAFSSRPRLPSDLDIDVSQVASQPRPSLLTDSWLRAYCEQLRGTVHVLNLHAIMCFVLCPVIRRRVVSPCVSVCSGKFSLSRTLSRRSRSSSHSSSRVPARPASVRFALLRRIRVSGGRIADPGRCPSLPAENPPRPSRPAPCLPGRGGPVYFSPIA